MDLTITGFGGVGDTLVLGPSLGTTTSGRGRRPAGRSTATWWLGASRPRRHRPEAGLEIADLASAVLARIDGRFDYAGVSLGGPVGLQLLVQAPARVTTATLLATGARIGEPAAWRGRPERVRRDGLAWPAPTPAPSRPCATPWPELPA